MDPSGPGGSLPPRLLVFECTNDCTDLTSASFLSAVGKQTEVLLRVSMVGPESGSADTLRDVHGWAMKLHTDQGNLESTSTMAANSHRT
ncbi:catalase-domain-containing protein [Aspergillus ellipticus CBS 707.79]|uniref:Catalase-domain-containing protein n=1 Tax=Aspergillus ellipticus CBS 707.79 TaxID=1448320 RepID=A0A319EAS0_9EURO|nr:catalase-domain-containing protein [Aspergillus ellipticus CBS 707.79]